MDEVVIDLKTRHKDP